MAICTILAAMNIYVSLHPPKAETIQIEPARDDDDQPLMSGTPIAKKPREPKRDR
jgi:hypothetical protein